MKHPLFRLRYLFALLVVALLAHKLAAEPKVQTADDKKIAENVCVVLADEHVTQHPVDDEMSRRLYRRFLETLDPRKMYFLESDLREFSAQETLLDDQLLKGDLGFAYAVYARYLERLDADVALVTGLTQEKFDFAVEDQVPLEVESISWPKDAADAKARWHSLIKYDILFLVVDGVKEDEARTRIEKRYQRLAREQHNQFKDYDLVEMYLTAFTRSFDPHSDYMSPHTLEDFNIQMRLSLEGIGATLSTEEGVCVVKEVVPGGAADLDGRLKPGDHIVGVGQDEAGDMVDVVEMRLRDAVTLIRGKAGTKVRLELMQEGSPTRSVVALTRQKIELRDRAASGEIVDAPAEPGATPLRIGIVHLASFYADDPVPGQSGRPDKSATEDVRRVLKDFVAKHVDGVVVDLFRNGGGLLPEAICVTGLFLDEGPVVQVKDPHGRISVYPDEEPGMVWGGPLLVLSSRLTASASEIFAGAIQDYGRGIVVGDVQSHGKGTVQKIMDLGEGLGALKFTIQQFYRPGGDSTQNHGVAADVALPWWTDDDAYGEAKLPYALAFDRIPTSQFTRAGMVTAEQIVRLKELSGMRRTSHEDLRALDAQTRQLRERRDRKVLTFTEASLKAERAQAAEEGKLVQDAMRESSAGAKEPAFGSTPYTREVLAILADLIRLQHEDGGKK